LPEKKKEENSGKNSCVAYACYLEDTCGYYIGCYGERRKSSRNIRSSGGGGGGDSSSSSSRRRKRGMPNT